jgi:hypothetical protein
MFPCQVGASQGKNEEGLAALCHVNYVPIWVPSKQKLSFFFQFMGYGCHFGKFVLERYVQHRGKMMMTLQNVAGNYGVNHQS